MNSLSKTVSILDRVSLFCTWTNWIGVACFFLMVLLTFLDVFLRYIFNHPLPDSKSFSELIQVIVISLSIAYTQTKNDHVTVDLITSRLRQKPKLLLQTATNFICVGICGLLIWRSLVQLLWCVETNKMHGSIIPIPVAPFEAVILLGCFLLFLMFLRDFLRNINDGLGLSFKSYQWLLALGMPILLLVFIIFWIQPSLWQINLITLGLIGIVISLLFMFSGLPIGFSLILSGFIFIGHIRGAATALDTIGVTVFATWSDYNWIAIGFFVLMGYFCLSANFGRDIYHTAYKWLGSMRGGLAVATIGACTAFAGIVGDALSVTTTMGTVALPEMRKYRYDDSLSTGTIAAGAIIGPTIPPSMGAIMYAVLTGLSMGKLFIAGIVPGLLYAVIFISIIYIRCRLNRKLGPTGEKSTLREKVVSLKYAGPILFLFLLVIGGIYIGIFTAIEGGAIGASGALIISLIMKRSTWKNFFDALIGAGKILGMVFIVIFGATVFAKFIAWCNLTDATKQLVIGLSLSPHLVVIFFLLIFFALGFVMDIVPLILIGVPIIHPICTALGFDPIWVAWLFILTIGLGTITPPVALVLFAIKGVAADIPIATIFRGVFPFIVGAALAIVLLYIFPSLITWLPNLLY